MGNSSLRPVLAADAANFQADLPKFILQSKIGNGKLMKTYLMRCESNSVVVKVYMSYPDEDLRSVAAELTRIWYTVSPSRYPNLLPYQLWMKSISRQPKSNVLPVYLIRQYLYSNLHDRMSTRPFLNETEKLWILFQLFKCIEVCHSLQIMHGDIKPENVLCTTSNWVVLTDFAAFKPVNVPDDNPSDFQYFFDSMGRPRCYIAPERFHSKSKIETKLWGSTGVNGEKGAALSPAVTKALASTASSLSALERNSESALLYDSVFGDAASAVRSQASDSESLPGKRSSKGAPPDANSRGRNGDRDALDKGEAGAERPHTELTAGMDVFSLGCTIAEVLLDGEPFLDLPGMLKYADRNDGTIGDSSGGKPADPKGGTGSEGSSRLSHLDVPGSPAKGALDRIGAGVNGVPRSELKQLIVHMTQRHPSSRLTVAEYRQQLEAPKRGSDSSDPPFPAYFGAALYPLFMSLHWEGVGPDQRISILCERYGALVESMTGVRDEVGHAFFLEALRKHSSSTEGDSGVGHGEGRKDLSKESDRAEGAMNRDSLTQLSTRDFLLRCQQSIAEAELRFTGKGSSATEKPLPSVSGMQSPPMEGANSCSVTQEKGGNSLLYFGAMPPTSDVTGKSKKGGGRGMVLLIQLVTSTFRHLSLPRSKIASVMLLVRLGLCCCDDDVVLKRVLPCLLLALSDGSSAVRALSVRALTALLSSVRSISSFESNLFPQYLFAPLSVAAKDMEINVRVAFAECLGTLSETAKGFLDMAHKMALKQVVGDAIAAGAAADTGGKRGQKSNEAAKAVPLSEIRVEFPYDSKLKVLHDQVIRWIREVSSSAHTQKGEYPMSASASLTSSTGPSLVKRALLGDIGRLCLFFGQEATADLLLTQVLTFLNDQDWELRLAFCLKIPTVCAFLGSTVTSECILPFLENALADSEERVIAQSLRCVTTLVQLHLLSRLMTVDVVKSAAPLLLHPRPTIRAASLSLVEAAAGVLGTTDTAVFLLPLLRPALTFNLTGVPLTADLLSQALIDPLSWKAFRRTLGERQALLITSLFSPKDLPSQRASWCSSLADQLQGTESPAIDASDRSRAEGGHQQSIGDDVPDRALHGEMNDSWIVSSSAQGMSSFDYEEDQNDMVDEYGEDQWGEQDQSFSEHKSSIATPLQRDADRAGEGVPLQVTVPFEDASEPMKLQFVSDYVDLAAREFLSRATHGQGQGPGIEKRGEGRGGQGEGFSKLQAQLQESDSELIRSRGRALSLALGQVTRSPSLAATGLSEHLAHSLLVPHQKFGSGVTLAAFSAGNLPPPLPPSGASTPTPPFPAETSHLFLSEADREAAIGILSGAMDRVPSRAALLSIFGVQAGDMRGEGTHGFTRRGALGASHADGQGAGAVPPTLLSGYIGGSASAGKVNQITEATFVPLVATAYAGKEEVGKEKETNRAGLTATNAFRGVSEETADVSARSLSLISRLRALHVPPLPPDLGSLQHADGRPYSSVTESLNAHTIEARSLQDPGSQAPLRFLRPSPGSSPPPPLILMAVLSEHTASVNRLAVSPDQSYFVTGSSDCCVKIWQLKGLDKAAFPRSSITYTGHAKGISDLCVIENSHSVASASQDGQVHVWRVELACSSKRHPKAKEGTSSGPSPGGQVQGSGLSVRGLSVVRTLDPADGAITALQHFTSEMASVVVFATQKGGVAGWDLRSTQEAFRYSVRPEFGTPTCIALPPDSNVRGWVMVGTSRGYILLWDLRFNMLSAAWRHSSNGPIHKMFCVQSHTARGAGSQPSSSIGMEGDEDTYDTVDMDVETGGSSSMSDQRGRSESDRGDGDYLVIAAGPNETAVWTLPISKGGACMKSFRAVPIATSRDRDREEDSPRLTSVLLPSHPLAPVQEAIYSILSPISPTQTSSGPSVRSFLSHVSPDGKGSHLITGGTDGLLRYWDWTQPSKCCVLSGLSPTQHRPAVVSVKACTPSSVRGVDADDRQDSHGDVPPGDRRASIPSHSISQHQGQQQSLFVCYDTEAPSPSRTAPSFEQAQLPTRDAKGTTHSPAASEDAILDLGVVQSSRRLLLSCGRDGLVKLWR